MEYLIDAAYWFKRQSKEVKALIGVGALLASLATVHEVRDIAHQEHRMARPITVPETVFEGTVKTAAGSAWNITCEGPITNILVRAGDTLLRIALNNTNWHDPVNVERPDIPQEVKAATLAQMNAISSPDKIVVNDIILTPASCTFFAGN